MSELSYTLYETDANKYVEAHTWQISAPARLIRRMLRQKAYTRWTYEAFTDVVVRGLEHLEKLSGPAVFIANHQSHLDTLLVHAALPEAIRSRLYFGAAQDRWYLSGQKKLTLKPWYQSLALGNFPIRRGGGSQALDHARWLLGKGQNVFLFPEGTRAKGNELGEFKVGPALLAAQAKVPIVPLYLSGLQAIRPKGSRKVIPGPVACDVLEPVTIAEGDDLAATVATVRAAMNERHLRYATQTFEASLIEAPVIEASSIMEAA